MRRAEILMACGLAALGLAPRLAGGAHRPPLDQATPREAARANPYAGQPRAALAGGKLYRRECAACHGEAGEGTRRAPALAAPAVRNAAPGAVFEVLRNGSIRHGMPSYAHLSDAQRWQIVEYLKTR